MENENMTKEEIDMLENEILDAQVMVGNYNREMRLHHA